MEKKLLLALLTNVKASFILGDTDYLDIINRFYCEKKHVIPRIIGTIA